MPNEELSAGTKDDSEQKPIASTCSPTIGNTNVVCSQSQVSLETSFDINDELKQYSMPINIRFGHD